MSETPPILLRYDGEGQFTPPSGHWARLADKHFVIGKLYPLVPHEERSQATHAHYFASITSAWQSLPEEQAERFPTSEHLRKYALIKAGFCDTHTLICSSKAEAQRVANFMKPVDEFAIIIAKDATVTRYTAQSQSRRAMDKQTFAESKEKVLEIIAGMVGSTAKELKAVNHSAADYLGAP